VLVFLLLWKKIESPAEWSWFAAAYFLEYFLPTFDFFPWSYGRLFAVLIALGLMWRVSNRSGVSPSFVDAARVLDSIGGPLKASP